MLLGKSSFCSLERGDLRLRVARLGLSTPLAIGRRKAGKRQYAAPWPVVLFGDRLQTLIGRYGFLVLALAVVHDAKEIQERRQIHVGCPELLFGDRQAM